MSTSTPSTNQPTGKLRLGAINAAIWANQTGGEGRTIYSVTFDRRYKAADDSWKSADSFGRDDLLKLAKLADMVHSRIVEMQQADRSNAEAA